MITFDRYLWDLSSLRDGEENSRWMQRVGKKALLHLVSHCSDFIELVNKGKKIENYSILSHWTMDQ